MAPRLTSRQITTDIRTRVLVCEGWRGVGVGGGGADGDVQRKGDWSEIKS